MKMKKFFLNLYDKFIHLSWVEWTIAYCKENPVMAGIIAGALLLIILVLCIMSGKRRKAKKAKKEIAEQTKTPEPTESVTVVPEPKKEEPKPVEVKEEPKPVEVKEEPKPVEVKGEPKPVEVKEEPKPVAEKAKVEKMKEEKTTTKAKVPAKKLTKAKEVEETFAMVENIDESVPHVLRDNYEENETDKIARYKGKWVICRVLTDEEDSEEMYFFELRASNGEKLLSSEEYTSYQGALRGIQTHKTNILKGNLKITLSKKGDYIFKLLSGKNMLLCMGENYPTKARCESAIESTVRFAETAVIDENVQDLVIKVPKEDDTPIAPLPEGYNGKWIISEKLSDEGDKIYFFELFANNGEKLLSSEEYTTYIGAVNGIQTHKKNIEQDNFRISLTKRGDYIYKLLNGNSQLLCLGEHYKTKRLCLSAVESVKRFAVSSPVFVEEKKK